MLKPIFTGMTVGAVVLLPAAMPAPLAEAQPQVPVKLRCPQAIWAGDYAIGEFIPLGLDNYKSARVRGDHARVLNGYGFDAEVVDILNQGAPLTVLGEAWDSACNQWMKVKTFTGVYWMQGTNVELTSADYQGLLPSTLPNVELTLADYQGLSTPSNIDSQAVSVRCPEATWTDGFQINELIALTPDRYKGAKVVGSPSNGRSGAGFDSSVVTTLRKGTPVTVMGEAWDGGCNQWMQVQVGNLVLWMHSSTLRFTELPPPVPSGQGNGVSDLVTDQCPNTPWTVGYRINELIPLEASKYHTAVAIANSVRVRTQAGFEGPVKHFLNAGEPVTVTGEAWDSGCNQWMQVQMGSDRYWVNGNLLRNLSRR